MATSRLLALRKIISPRIVPNLNTLRLLNTSKVLSSKPFYSITYETGSGEKYTVQVMEKIRIVS